MSPQNSCVTCGAPLAGRFCHVCGEKRVEEQDQTVRALAHYATEAVTNADAKLYVTVRRLFRRPGLLTREFVDGRRKPYVGPIQLFLLANLLFFVLLQLGLAWDTFTTDLAWHRTQPLYGSAAEAMIQDRAGAIPAREGRPFDEWIDTWTVEQMELRTRFNEASPRYANSMVILMIPLFALGIRLLRRRGLIVRDLVFSMHFYAFLLLFSIAFTMALLVGLVLPGRLAQMAGLDDVPAVHALFSFVDVIFNNEAFVTAMIMIPVAIYLVAGFRTAYGDGIAGAVLRALASIGVLFFVVTLYRAMLFFVVFWAV